MSRRLWRCRNLSCPVPHGAVLGRVTEEGGLILTASVAAFRIFLDTRRAEITCPSCGARREFRGVTIIAARYP